jgi:hypothetical protein
MTNSFVDVDGVIQPLPLIKVIRWENRRHFDSPPLSVEGNTAFRKFLPGMRYLQIDCEVMENAYRDEFGRCYHLSREKKSISQLRKVVGATLSLNELHEVVYKTSPSDGEDNFREV